MPRVTVAMLKLDNEQMEYEITLLQQKNDELQAEVQSRRDRSRSRRRKVEFKVEPISARTMMALDIVCKRDRDHVIDEQRATIAKQAQEIERLKRGEGLVKTVLCAAFDWNETTNSIVKHNQTVREYMKQLWKVHNSFTSSILFGGPEPRR